MDKNVKSSINIWLTMQPTNNNNLKEIISSSCGVLASLEHPKKDEVYLNGWGASWLFWTTGAVPLDGEEILGKERHVWLGELMEDKGSGGLLPDPPPRHFLGFYSSISFPFKGNYSQFHTYRGYQEDHWGFPFSCCCSIYMKTNPCYSSWNYASDHVCFNCGWCM